MTPKARTFWPVLLVLVLADCTSKDLVVEQLTNEVPYTVVNRFLRFTLVYNPDMAFGIDLTPYLGAWARPALIVLMLAIIGVMMRVYLREAPRARVMAAGLALAIGGAIGNLIDRFRSPLGVVDFIDVGVGAHRFYVFNVADAGVTIGSLIIALALLREPLSQTENVGRRLES
jgi:signal peptidase II